MYWNPTFINKNRKLIQEMNVPHQNQKDRIPTTVAETKFFSDLSKCDGGSRLCEDGNCVPNSQLCPEQEEMNENTILIMVIIGTVVLIFLFILYCFQHRSQNRNSRQRTILDDGDNASLNMPPPAYNEVISTNLYPPSENNFHNSTRMPSAEEPITPPPNYDAALHILACSQEHLYSVKSETPVIRRSVSSDVIPSSPGNPSRVSGTEYRRNLSSSAEERS